MSHNDYDIIVVPATERRNDEGRFPDFEKTNSDQRIYTGGHVRMQAAVRAAEAYPKAEFIMLGGWAKKNGELLSKAEDMKEYIETELDPKSRRVRIETINSLPSTRGNLVALLNTLKKNPERHVAILSNGYHKKRILSLWENLTSTEQTFKHIKEPAFITVGELGLTEAIGPESPEYQLRVRNEAQGIQDLFDGVYREPKRVDVSAILERDPESIHTIFTPTERITWQHQHNETKFGESRK